MCKCSYNNCQFEGFLKKDKDFDYPNKLSGGHRYCIFHDKKENKDSHADYFDELIHKYIEYRVLNSKNSGVHINFNGVIFLEFNFHNLVNMYENSKKDTSVKINHDNKKLNFKFDNAVFESYARFDNIKCNKITFKDTKFLSGGSIKSREKKDNLEIDTLVFRPLELGSDFMIDLGKYADENSILSTDEDKLRFINFPIINEYNSKIKTFSLDENNSLVSLYYSFSHIALPFIPKEKQLFVKVTQKAVLLGYLESILLWFFAGAFVLAISHRIRR